MFQIDFNKPIHVFFCGIGGISMSGLAEILHSRGFKVSGSDMKASSLTAALENKGIKVYIGQRTTNITPDIDLYVYTAAIHKDNPEWIEMTRLGIPSLSRAELLGEIMKNFDLPIAISGTHGKTTTTSMISEILLGCDLDPTLSVGGMLKSIGGNIRIGHSKYFVTEACEYTNSFLSFFPRIALILNIEEDHMDFFKDIDDIRHSFLRFASLLPMDGALVINGEIDDLEEITGDLPCNIYTFGFNDSDTFHATDISYDDHSNATYTLHCPDGTYTVTLAVPGRHNVANSMAALCCATLCDIPISKAIKLIGDFHGTDRRFEYKGSVGEVTVIDDYAHHPTEIASTLNSARNFKHNRLFVVFQPHTYTRTKAFLDDFAKSLSIADVIILADIYAAREKNTIGISSRDLQARLLEMGSECYYFPSFDEIENFCLEKCSSGDLLITMGAGDIVKVGESILGL